MKSFARRCRPQHDVSVTDVQHGNIQLQAGAEKRRNGRRDSVAKGVFVT